MSEEDFAELRDRNEELDEVTEKLETLPENLVKYAQVARDLALGLVPVLVVEVFCAKDSALCKACARENVAYIGITEEENLLLKSMQLFLGEVMLSLLGRKPPKICLHIASPCTAGCSFRFKELAQTEVSSSLVRTDEEACCLLESPRKASPALLQGRSAYSGVAEELCAVEG